MPTTSLLAGTRLARKYATEPAVFQVHWTAPPPTAGSEGSNENGELNAVIGSQPPWKSNVKRSIQSTVCATWGSSQLPVECTLPPGMSTVSVYCLPVIADWTSSCRLNSCSNSVALCVSAGEWCAPLPGSTPGYSQSMLMPSKRPAAAPSPPAYGGHAAAGRFPFRIRSMHELTNAARDAGVAAASEK